VSRSTHAEEGESLPYNHHLHQFLTCLKHERGFAEATIVNRARSLKPFLGWLVAQDVPLSTMSPGVITTYFTGIGRASGSGQPSRSMYSLCARFFAMPAVEVGARRASRRIFTGTNQGFFSLVQLSPPGTLPSVHLSGSIAIITSAGKRWRHWLRRRFPLPPWR
jgi:hypothetical protein